MKKIILLFAIGLITTLSFGQDFEKSFSIGGDEVMVTSDRDGELDCPVNSIFGQTPVSANNGFFSDKGTLYNSQNIFENFSGLTGDIGGITFWGLMWEGADCYTPGSQDFEISFFQDNAGTIGTIIQPPFTVTITPTETGSFLLGASVLRYDINFPSSISLPSGWFSVVKLNPGDDDCTFAWINTTNGDNISAWNQMGGTYNTSIDNISFCLTSGAAAIPVSNWALGIGLLLISGFIVVRFRRRLA